VAPSFFVIGHDQISPIQGSSLSRKLEEGRNGGDHRHFRQTPLAL
jgi:hypothetical protein